MLADDRLQEDFGRRGPADLPDQLWSCPARSIPVQHNVEDVVQHVHLQAAVTNLLCPPGKL